MENKKIKTQQKISEENIDSPKEKNIEADENIQEISLDSEDDGVSGTKIHKVKEIEAIVHVYTSYNNTIVHVTDMSGRTIIKISGGMITKQDRLKANPTIAMFIAKRISEKMKEEKIKNLYLRVRAKTGNPAPGPGANAIVKSLSREGFKIINILDTTRIPRGGPKIKGGRRGRRP
ncbi:30S ribosomal protein S11 [Candidatus Pacearchaeota archaeon]|nr:30S ribosomal protein S11 [Candidatus Pacearchaeota archaeon]MBI2057158.1 30S ribosomal protein S11 [Candidatus Pacearchaeota archaeon]